MNGVHLEESNMKFGPFAEDELFILEKCSIYQMNSCGIQIAEFALVKPKKGNQGVYVIEAKSSSPKPGSEQNFDQYIKEIYTKFINSFYLITAVTLKRHKCQTGEVPTKLANLNLTIADFRFVLVINGHKDEWLPQIQDSLKSALIPFQKMWNCNPDFVAVINDQKARAKNWIS